MYPVSGTVLYNNDSVPTGTIGGAMIIEISGVHNYNETDEGRLGKTFFGPHEERFEMPRKLFQKDFNITGPPVKIVR
jgi:hypothetical protein